MKTRLVFSVIAVLISTSSAYAESLFRVDFGAFNGRIARTSGGSTVPLNTALSNVATGELQLGSKRWRFLVGGSYHTYRAKVFGSTEYTEFTYGDGKAGVVYATNCCEWKLLGIAARTPYTDQPDPVTLDPVVMNTNYVMLENILSAKVSAYKLSFAYWLKYMPTALDIVSNGVVTGQMTNNYYIGGCVRVFFVLRHHVGPSICVDLQELYLPNSTVVTRQEVSGRLAIEF